MLSFFSNRRRIARASAAGALLAALVLPFALPARGQVATSGQEEPAGNRGRILLVLPFDNGTGQPSLEWIREAAAELISSRLASAGFAPLRREDRLYALDHLGLPEGFQPSRASALKLAQTLDADSILVGSFKMDDTYLVAEARVVDVPHLRMSPPVTVRGPLASMITVFDTLAWKLTKVMDPQFGGSEAAFVEAGKGIRVDAFEQYIRGITEPDQEERLKHLEQSVKLDPKYGPAWMALGREYYDGQEYEKAADAFARVDRGGPDGLKADFYRGLALLFSGEYVKSEAAFGQVVRVLPLAEVLNNEGVAISRQGRDGSELFRRAVKTDPRVGNYHFNLAVSLKRKGANSEALAELNQCLKLRPNDSEAQSLLADWTAPAGTVTDPDEKPDPLERIARRFDASAFRQAALMMNQVELARLSELAPRERAKKLSGQAKEYLDRGLLLESERLYQSAVNADGSLAEAHAGLAQVRERIGDAAGARKEAEQAIALQPSAEAYLVVARLDLAANHLEKAGQEARDALQLDPQSQEAGELVRRIDAKAAQKQ